VIIDLANDLARDKQIDQALSVISTRLDRVNNIMRSSVVDILRDWKESKRKGVLFHLSDKQFSWLTNLAELVSR